MTLSLPARQVLFDRFDTDGNGTLDEKEFVDACSLMGLRFPIMELSMMFRNVDADCSGGIDLDEFTDLIKLLRWKRMGLLTMGMWQSGKAEIELGGLGMFQNWEEQQTWLENQILQGQGLASSGDRLSHIDADKMKAFRIRLRNMFEEFDMDHSGELDMDELREALAGFGLYFTDDTVREMFAFCDKDGSGTIDYNEFEQAILDIFFGRHTQDGGGAHGWQGRVLSRLESRLRPPPPARPRFVHNQVGSVKAREDCERTDLHGQQVGERMWNNSMITEDHGESMVTINIVCANMPTTRDRLFRKPAIPGFPCRPVVVLNAEEPRSNVWFRAGYSNWLDGLVHPFQQCISLSHFEAIRKLELVAYDLEVANGDGSAQQEHTGTAMIGITTLWVPGRVGAAVRQRGVVERGPSRPVGTLHVKVERGLRLPKSDVFGLSDPFVEVRVGSQKKQTHVELCTLDPQWGDEFEFQLIGLDSEHTLKLDVYDWDIENNDFLGRCEIEVESLCSRAKEMKPVETWYHLRRQDGHFVWGTRVANAAQAAELRRKKEALHERQARQGNILTGIKNKLDDYRNKFVKIPVTDARNMTASPDLCLGSIQIGHHDLMQALAAGRTRRVRINAHRNSAQVNMQNIVTMLMRGALSTGECFLEWKELVHREKNLKYFGLGNHPDKYASLHIEAAESTDGGHENVRIGVACKNLPKLDMFGKVDCFLKFEVMELKGPDNPNPAWRCFHRTEVVKKNLNPHFNTFLTTAEEDLNNSTVTQIRISAYDWDMMKDPELIGWVKTNMIELEALCRSKGTLKLKDPDPKKRRYRGELVPYNCHLWRSALFTKWDFTLHVTVHSWVPGDAFTIKDSEKNRNRANAQIQAHDLRAKTLHETQEMMEKEA